MSTRQPKARHPSFGHKTGREINPPLYFSDNLLLEALTIQQFKKQVISVAAAQPPMRFADAVLKSQRAPLRFQKVKPLKARVAYIWRLCASWERIQTKRNRATLSINAHCLTESPFPINLKTRAEAPTHETGGI